MTNDKDLNTKFLELMISKAVDDRLRAVAPPQPKPIDEGEALDVIVNHLNTCRDGNCQVTNKLEDISNNLFQPCPECSKIVRKDSKTCRHCGESFEEEDF